MWINNVSKELLSTALLKEYLVLPAGAPLVIDGETVTPVLSPAYFLEYVFANRPTDEDRSQITIMRRSVNRICTLIHEEDLQNKIKTIFGYLVDQIFKPAYKGYTMVFFLKLYSCLVTYVGEQRDVKYSYPGEDPEDIEIQQLLKDFDMESE